MREIYLDYVEVLNETEQALVFKTLFNREEYGVLVTLNTAQKIPVQDAYIARELETLINIDRKAAKKAT